MRPNKILKHSILAAIMSAALPFSVLAETYDFKACVQVALTHNPEIEISQSMIDQAKAGLRKAESSRLPQINLSVTAANSDNALSVFGMKLQQRSVVQADFIPADLNNPKAYSDFNTRIELLLPVWNGGKISSYEDQAAEMIKAAQQGDLAVQQYLTYNVYQAYEAVHAARAYIHVAEQAKLTADEFVRTTKNLMDEGVVVRSEYLTAKVHQSMAEVALLKAQGQEQIAFDSLRMLMNLEVGAPIDIAGRFDLELSIDSAEELLGQAMSSPELEAKRKEASSSLFAVEAAKADYYPNFNVMLRQDWNDQSLNLANGSYTIAGVVSWKVTDFGVTSSSVDIANASALQKRAKVRSEENRVRLEVLTAWRKMQVAKKQVQSDLLAVKQSSEAQSLILKRYKGGVATMTEVLATQTQLDKARADLVSAQYDLNVYKAKLKLATGTMDIQSL